MIVQFLRETLQRFFMKNPKYFKWWQLILAIVALATGLPEILETYQIVLPDALAALASKTASIAAIANIFLLQLTVSDTAKRELNITEKKKQLPFTTKKEKV